MSDSTPAESTATPGKTAATARGWFLAVLPVALIAACAELGTAVLNNSTLPVFYNKALNISTAVIPLIMVPFYVSEALFKSPLGILADKVGRKPLMFGGACITVFTPILLTLIYYHPDTSSALAVLVLFGFLRLLDGLGGAALWPALFAYVGDVVVEEKRGAAMGLLNVTYMVGLAMGFLAGGFVDDTFGPVFTGRETLRYQMRLAGRNLRRAGRNMREGMDRRAHSMDQRAHRFLQKHGIGGQGGTPHAAHAAHRAHAVHALHALSSSAAHVSASSGAAGPSAPIIMVPLPVPPDTLFPGHYYPSFYLASILFALAAVVSLLALRTQKKPAAGSAHDHEAAPVTLEGFITAMRKVPQFLLLSFTTFFGIGCIVLLVKLFVMDEFGLTEKQVGILTLFPALAIAALAVPVGHLADKWGKTRSVRLGFLLCSIGLWGIPILHHMHTVREVGFVISASCIGIGFVIGFPAWLALLTSLSSSSQRGTVIGAVSTAQSVGVLLGTILGGKLYSHISPIAPFVAAAAFVSVGTLIALVSIRESAIRKIAQRLAPG